MEKKLMYYNEVQIMRNEMEHVKQDNGTVEVIPKTTVAGDFQTFKVTYTVGKDPIYIGGVIRFTIPFGSTKPQVDMPIHPGYVTAYTTKAGATVKTKILEGEWWKRGEDRTKLENVSEHVGSHIWVKVSGSKLTTGDKVILTYGDTSYSDEAVVTACKVIGPIQFDVATDAHGRLDAPYSGFYLVEDSPTVMVMPQKAVGYEVIVPSEIKVHNEFKAVVFAKDIYKNLVIDHIGTIECYIDDELVCHATFDEKDCGVKHLKIEAPKTGTLNLKVKNKKLNLIGTSNPTVCSEESPEYNHFWGDMHGHTGIQWGRGSGRAYYEYARDVAGLDFCSLTDPDAGRYTNDNETAYNSLSCYMTEEKWEEIQNVNKSFYKKGAFVPILGYEYHNDAPNPEFGGDRNVYYASYDEPIRRCVDEGSYYPAQLWEELKNTKAITIPHHTAKKVMLGSWDVHDEEIQRLVEIYSSWGNSECEGCERPIIGGSKYDIHSVQYALNKGYRVGFVSGSDTHGGTPGFSHWVFSEEVASYRGGLTCVISDELSKESVFDALWNRNVYATTGERILLDFKLNGVNMGQELPLKNNQERKIEVNVIGTDDIDKVEIISKGGSIIYTKKGDAQSMNFTFSDDSYLSDGWTYYYIRVLQKNKAMAWSSPIWVS